MKLNKYDLERVTELIPEKVRTLMFIHGKDLVLAGGFIRDAVLRVRAKDVDLFTPSKEKALEVVKDLNTSVTEFGQAAVYTSSKNAYSFKNVGGRFVQFIHRWSYPGPQELLNSFDFTVACAAVWYDNGWESLVDNNFYPDLAAKRLVFRFPERQEDPAGSMIRVLKFVKKGYTIPGESLAGVVARISTDAQKKDQATYVPGTEAEFYSSEKNWTRIIHNSIATVTGES
jgi:hypothetical protein